ncbi:MAG TPA: hypothetical protein VFC84_08105, partial [Desulfosporosinus sp.]|nr:hypothetical protein [Desulfosporosinus sp.]
SDDIRGEIEIVYGSDQPSYCRKKPAYWPHDKRKVILVDGIDQNTDIEVLRAFLYVACLNGGYDRDIPEDKIPEGSGFVFLASDDFPFERFASITEYWYEEARIFEVKDVETVPRTQEKFERGISKLFIDALENDKGLGLDRILKLVKRDSTLCLEIRKDYINIYYRGGNLMKISEDRGRFAAHFDAKYITDNLLKKLPPSVLSTDEDVTEWLVAIPLLKHEMDLWFGQNPKNEREFQQLMVRENNFKGAGKGTDYFICDIEYTFSMGRFDLIAAYWPSSGAERKNNINVGLAIIEMKYMDGALTAKAGIRKHIVDMKNYLDPVRKNLALLKDEMKRVFNQKQALKLIDNQKHIEKFNGLKPEYIFVFANHDPDSKILYNELQEVKAIANDLPFELKFATSNFMGYGLYTQNIYGLDDFMKCFCKQIYSKAPGEIGC